MENCVHESSYLTMPWRFLTFAWQKAKIKETQVLFNAFFCLSSSEVFAQSVNHVFTLNPLGISGTKYLFFCTSTGSTYLQSFNRQMLLSFVIRPFTFTFWGTSPVSLIGGNSHCLNKSRRTDSLYQQHRLPQKGSVNKVNIIEPGETNLKSIDDAN